MSQIKDYESFELIKTYNDSINLWQAEDNTGNEVEILIIDVKIEFKSLIKRVFRNEIAPLLNENIEGIQKVIEYDLVNNQYYIVYKNSQSDFKPLREYNKKNLLNFVCTLNNLKKTNRYGFIISPDTFFVNEENKTLIKFIGLFEIFKAYNLLSKESLSPEVLDNNLPKTQDDIYGIGKLYQDYLSLELDISKFLSEKKEERYRKYAEVIDVIKQIKEDNIEQNYRQTIQVVSQEQEKFKPILEEMNEECYWLLDSKKSEKGNNITGRFCTNSYSGRFFLDNQNYLYVNYSEDLYGSNRKIESKGEIANYNFSELSSDFNIVDFFQVKYEELNMLSELNKQHHDALKKWAILPKNEKKFIEDKAFKAQYFVRENTKSNNQDIVFKLNEKFRDWKAIKELRKEKVILSINEDRIGEILTYNPKEFTITIRDTKRSIDEIPETGELIQDVSQETSQYKKQEEACDQFKIRNVQNPHIASILATPENMPSPNRVVLDYDDFENKVFSEYLKNDDSQKEAVLEALNKKPVYLIQGPPGTGKTTVIVELVQQLVSQNSNVKILITSQSNLAVDNVLERLPEDILFMRLASEQAAEKGNISEQIKEHLFDTKLKNWVSETQEKSTEYINNRFGEKFKNKALISFYSIYGRLSKAKNDKAFVNKFLGELRVKPNYIKRLFEKVNSKKDIDSIFKKELGADYMSLLKIQKDWFAFTSNATSDDGKKKKSMLNNGSTEIDLHTAYCKTINVFGATCIHIASSKYSDIDFKFDYVIMDESSKASPAETLVPSNMAKNLILIGDHKQLPPVITRENAIKDKVKEELNDNGLDFDKEFGASLFESLITAFKDNNSLLSYTKMLDIQYRMPRQLGALISKHFYEGDLKNPDTRLESLKTYDNDKAHNLNLKTPTVSILDKFSNTQVNVPSSILFISTSNQDLPYDNNNKFNRSNTCNVTVIQEVLKTLNKQYIENIESDNPFNIGVIAGYRGQVNLLKDTIDTKKYSNFYNKPESLIEINTVDKFQGAERDIIIYDIVRSSAAESVIGFLDDYRRINVAFSRAKRLLIIVGDSEYILKRAKLHPNSNFEELKLKSIVQELEQQGLVFNTLNDAIND
ncbi:AAA domain-containing protein [uncultured Lacinutrix sp.]|uniref:AAA domain-containing protein n=1 Tax=uncultured Lacinutrix sp. TaxID=574032 RepID=UPI002638ACEF|nr:AAA domain-containing protein [uncultured Lacinutrix sp.]